jgi:archaellum component FlaG (FlaF/FlaG flagellin family)
MASESVGTAILVIAGVILAAMVSAALLSQANLLDSSMRLAMMNAQNRLETSISIALASLNTTATGKHFVIYVKNTGSRPISSAELVKTDLYLVDDQHTVLMVYSSSGGYNKWNYTEVNPNGVWDVGETLVVKAFNSTSFSIPMRIVIALPNGIRAEYVYSG